MKNICFPTDFSELSLKTLDLAKKLSAKLEAELHLIHVISSSVKISYGKDLLEDVHQKAALKHFDDIKNRWKLSDEVHITCLRGNTIKEILQYSENNKIDMIFMPTHGYTGFTRLMLGNVTNKVLRQSSVPVFVVNPKTQKEFDVNKVTEIIAATDFSKLSNAALPFAAELAQQLNAKLNLTHVLTDYKEMVGIYGNSFDLIPSYGSFSGYLKEQKERAKTELQQLQTKLNQQYDNLEINAVLIDGEPDDSLLEEGKNQKNNIMVMSTHGYNELENIVIGSTTEHVIQNATFPVVSIRPCHPFEENL